MKVESPTSFSLPVTHVHKPNIEVNRGQYQAKAWNPLPSDIINRISGKSWNEDCPVALENFSYIQVTHLDLDGKVVTGELIYHKTLATEIIDIFQDLFDANYPIERMQLIDDFDAIDDLSIEENNSSAFCSRPITGKPGIFSKHSYGCAIDINPRINPYVKGSLVLPNSATEYVDRSIIIPGTIVEGDACYEAFSKRGYTWGGNWGKTFFNESTGQDELYFDYQHFEKDPEVLGL